MHELPSKLQQPAGQSLVAKLPLQPWNGWIWEWRLSSSVGHLHCLRSGEIFLS